MHLHYFKYHIRILHNPTYTTYLLTTRIISIFFQEPISTGSFHFFIALAKTYKDSTGWNIDYSCETFTVEGLYNYVYTSVLKKSSMKSRNVSHICTFDTHFHSPWCNATVLIINCNLFVVSLMQTNDTTSVWVPFELMCAWTKCSRPLKTHLRLSFIHVVSILSLLWELTSCGQLCSSVSGKERREKERGSEWERAIIALPPLSSTALICPWSGKDLTEDADLTKFPFAPSPHSPTANLLHTGCVLWSVLLAMQVHIREKRFESFFWPEVKFLSLFVVLNATRTRIFVALQYKAKEHLNG